MKKMLLPFLLISLIIISCKITVIVRDEPDDLWIYARNQQACHDEFIDLYREYPDFDGLSERERVEWLFDHDNEYPVISEQVIIWSERYPDRMRWFWVHPRLVIWMEHYPSPEIIFERHEVFCYHFIQHPSANYYFDKHPGYVNIINNHTTVNNYFIHNDRMRTILKG